MKRVFVAIVILFFCVSLLACSSKMLDSSKKENSYGELIVEKKSSPNKPYVSSEEDIIYDTVKIYQDKDNLITVDTESNSSFFKPIQYTIECDENITEEDVNIQWTTLMGDVNATEDNQLAVAVISISLNNKVISERKIDFVNGGMEIVIDSIKNNV